MITTSLYDSFRCWIYTVMITMSGTQIPSTLLYKNHFVNAN